LLSPLVRLQNGVERLGARADFIALDVETAANYGSIYSIGLMHFKAGAAFKSVTVLVDPEDDFDRINIAIHGIRPCGVAGKPTMARALPVISAALTCVFDNVETETMQVLKARRYRRGGEDLPKMNFLT
jgi:DNA polymerase III epsilon subunit-like protein